MRRKFHVPLFMLLGVLLFAAAACSGSTDLPPTSPTPQRVSPSPPPPAPTPSDIPPTPGGGGGANGQEIVQQNGCRACHSIDGSAGIGPTWQGLFGKEEKTLIHKMLDVFENALLPG